MPRNLITHRWTPEDDQKLLDLSRQGKHPRVIVALVRRTAAAVYSRKSLLRRESGKQSRADAR